MSFNTPLFLDKVHVRKEMSHQVTKPLWVDCYHYMMLNSGSRISIVYMLNLELLQKSNAS